MLQNVNKRITNKREKIIQSAITVFTNIYISLRGGIKSVNLSFSLIGRCTMINVESIERMKIKISKI